MMKRISIAFVLMFSLFISGCIGNTKYYDTPKEAFIGFYGENIDVIEVGDFEYSDELLLYTAISEEYIFTCKMSEKDGRYRVNSYHIGLIPTSDIFDPLDQKGWMAEPNSNTGLRYKWVTTDSLPAERDTNYQYKDYVVDENLRLTLVYYESWYETET